MSKPLPGVPAALEAIARPGGVVLYPTSTVYGLGGKAADALAARRIAEMKGRPVGSLAVLALDPPLQGALALALAAFFWPAPLSIVVPAWPGLAPEVLGPGHTVAVRRPVHPVARRLVAELGAITSTSANSSGSSPVQHPSSCDLSVDAVVDVGLLPASVPSTLVHGESGAVLRQGVVPLETVRQFVRSFHARSGRLGSP